MLIFTYKQKINKKDVEYYVFEKARIIMAYHKAKSSQQARE